LAAKADIVIANGAECEPLLRKDAAVMEHWAAEVVAGLRLVMSAVGAKEGVIGIKARNKRAVEAIQAVCDGDDARVQLLGDYYPAGDEYDLVYTVTGRLIPPAGIPLQVGVVVNNVETLINVAAAARGRPVTHKTLTVAGAVRRPATVTVPVGASFREAIDAAGGLTTDEPILCIGGVMMGETTDNLDAPIIKTTTGAVILPRAHPVVLRKLKPARLQNLVGKSSCDQCRYCTEYCPRFLLGYAVEPHQVMRSLAFTATGNDFWNQWAALCCACGLCTLFACPEELFPKEACDQAKAHLKQAGLKWKGPAAASPHPLRDGRRVPIGKLLRRLQLETYDHPAPLTQARLEPRRVTVPLKQGAGAPNQPLVKPGDRVEAGQPLGQIPSGALGAPVHAPFSARVVAVTDCVVLERNP
jgi:Na+-translocating ferredoxin:NAD+ oxidoreductase RnfC subunit